MTINDINNRINLLLTRINNMINCDERYNYIYELKSYLSYLYFTGFIDYDGFEEVINKIIDNGEYIDNYLNVQESSNNLINYNIFLRNRYTEIEYLYSNHKLNDLDSYCNYVTLSKAMFDFIKYMNLDDIYLDLKDRNMIAKGYQGLESSISSPCYLNPFIILMDISKDEFDYYFHFIHELSHIYVNNIIKDKVIHMEYHQALEIIPYTIERIFLDFIKEYNYLKDGSLKRLQIYHEINRFKFNHLSLIITNIIQDNNYDLEYFKIYNKDNFNSEAYISLNEQFYGIANIISFKLYSLYKDNKELFKKSLPDIILELFTLNIEELFNKYYDINNIKTIIDSNLEKKKSLKK